MCMINDYVKLLTINYVIEHNWINTILLNIYIRVQNYLKLFNF